MTKYGADGQGNYRRKNEQVGTATLQTTQSGIGNVSIKYASRFRNTPIIVVTPYTTFSTYPGLTVVSSNQLFGDVKACLDGNISKAFSIGYIAIDDGPFP